MQNRKIGGDLRRSKVTTDESLGKSNGQLLLCEQPLNRNR